MKGLTLSQAIWVFNAVTESASYGTAGVRLSEIGDGDRARKVAPSVGALMAAKRACTVSEEDGDIAAKTTGGSSLAAHSEELPSYEGVSLRRGLDESMGRVSFFYTI